MASKHQGVLELTWTDKYKALLSVGDGSYDYQFVDPADYRVNEVRLLDEVERCSAETREDLPTPTTDNLLITGDAMHVLDALRVIPEYADKYLGKVKLCYIDPPFNTGQAFANYEDNVKHSVWLTLLRDRLEQIKPLLSEDGSVWVHLDDVEVHRCRCVLDEVMGSGNFVATVVWEKDKGRRSDTHISNAHDYLLIYACNESTWTDVRNLLPRSEAQLARYKNPDSDPRGPWLQGDNGTAKSASESSRWTITLPSGREVVPPSGRGWAFGKDTFEEARAEGRVYFGKSGDGMPIIKTYLTDVQQGVVPRTWWTADDAGHNQEAKRDHLNKMFPDAVPFATPKPERLLQRIIEIATQPGDIVLDCFAGSGTTAAVAQKMGRRWVTSELQSETVETYTKPRLLKVIRNEDERGITTITTRVAATDEDLPDGMTPAEAQEFNRLLLKAVKGLKEGDAATIRALRYATKTRDEMIVNWFGGGGFTHLCVRKSMFVESEGRVYLAEWAVNGALTNAMCAQLGIRHKPDGIFAGSKGKVRYVILDGMVTPSTVEAILDQLPEGEIVEIWATQADPTAAEALRKARPGSRLASIPASVLDAYRHKAAKQSPFKHAKNGDKSDG